MGLNAFNRFARSRRLICSSNEQRKRLRSKGKAVVSAGLGPARRRGRGRGRSPCRPLRKHTPAWARWAVAVAHNLAALALASSERTGPGYPRAAPRGRPGSDAATGLSRLRENGPGRCRVRSRNPVPKGRGCGIQAWPQPGSTAIGQGSRCSSRAFSVTAGASRLTRRRFGPDSFDALSCTSLRHNKTGPVARSCSDFVNVVD